MSVSIENDIWQAELRKLSDDRSDDEDNVKNNFWNLDNDSDFMDAVFRIERRSKKWGSLGTTSDIWGIKMKNSNSSLPPH